ncbi:hypothetical protein HYT58_00805 [Candidatus Woesearchaeota archaeon]|nr:hypothetical protein [Candidatus Woesearchaeota archaeon]
MMDKSREEQIVRWARFVRENPRSKWKPPLVKFLDSQIEIANRFYSNLKRTKEGRKTAERLLNLKIR